MPFDLPQGPCVFCERIAGESNDWAVIAEDDATLSFVNPQQFNEGQALVIPKRHAPTLLDLDEEEAAALMRHVRRLAEAMVETFDPDGLTLYQNNGVASYQLVPHVHMHVVPRRYGGGWGEGPPHLAALTRAEKDERYWRDKASPDRQSELADRIRRALNATG